MSSRKISTGKGNEVIAFSLAEIQPMIQEAYPSYMSIQFYIIFGIKVISFLLLQNKSYFLGLEICFPQSSLKGFFKLVIF